MAITYPNIPYRIFQKDYNDEKGREYYKKYFINKEGKFNAKYHKRYFVGIPTMAKAMKILGARYCESISILDGEGGNHLQADFAIFDKEGKYLGCAFLNSTGEIELCMNRELEKFKAYNCKDFLTKCREIRNYLQLSKPE